MSETLLTPEQLIEMALEWPQPKTEDGHGFSGDVLILRLGHTLRALTAERDVAVEALEKIRDETEMVDWLRDSIGVSREQVRAWHRTCQAALSASAASRPESQKAGPA